MFYNHGCGPGDDLVGYLEYSGAEKLIGIDISKKSLNLAGHRLSLHDFDTDRFELKRISDSIPSIPLGDKSVDFINCMVVIHHTSNPDSILKEFYRVLKLAGI